MVVKEEGSGQAVILIHGFCEDKEMWDSFSKELSTDFKIYCPDLPGFGESPLLDDSITLETIAIHLEEWLEANQIQDPIVIGHSLGGYVIMALAELMGQKIKAIGLFHSTSFADPDEKIKTRNKTITFIKKHGSDKFMDTFVSPLFAENNRKEFKEAVDLLTSAGKRASDNAAVFYTEAMRDRKDRFDVWKNYSGPKLFIAGILDPAIPIEDSRQHKAHSTSYHELEGVAHMGMFEAETKCLKIVRGFLEEVTSSDSN